MSIVDKNLNGAAAGLKTTEPRKTISMHEDIPVWYDCCTCEAEPYWLEAMSAASQEKKKVEKDK